MTYMPKVSIPQKNLIFNVPHGANLMNSLLASGLPVASSCHGEGICSMCKVKVTGLAQPLVSPVVKPAESFEIETLKRNKCASDERLSCQISVTVDLIVITKYW